MIKYVCDTSTDMHRDTSSDLFKLTHKEVTDKLRFYAKNQWVFAQFYGDYYGNCAKNIWKTCLDLVLDSGITVRDHLKSVGINNYDQFESHCKRVEEIFWKERFPGYAQWKNEVEMDFRKHGFIRLHTGFKCSGNLGRNQITNFGIQGPAFHCLLWSLIETNKVAKKEKWGSKIIGQIHDEMIFDLVPEEQDHVIKTVKEIGTVKIKEAFPWLIVPLSIDFEATEIDQAWVYAKEIKQ
jgi:DNA polymerase I-like protein with 3'-5' exonuclease and polymerase domains